MEVNVNRQKHPGRGPQQDRASPHLPCGNTAKNDEYPYQVIGGNHQAPAGIPGPHEKLGGQAKEPKYKCQPPYIEETPQELGLIKSGVYPGDDDVFSVTLNHDLDRLARLNVIKESQFFVSAVIIQGGRAYALNHIALPEASRRVPVFIDLQNFPIIRAEVKPRIGNNKKKTISV